MKKYTYLFLIILTIISCKTEQKSKDGTFQIVTTTTMITDMVQHIGGDKVNVQGLMGSGVDPHLYKASEGDVTKLFNADVIIYSGLHLEGKLEDIFEKMRKQQKKTIAVSDAVDKSGLIGSEYFASSYDPHIWFHIGYWKQATQFVVDELKKLDPEHAADFEKNGQIYLEKLDVLAKEIKAIIETLPVEKRILVTAHDAFNYFGKLHNFEVVGLQGLSTATEAGVQDVQKLANFIIEKNIKAIFVESSVPKRTIEALQAAVKSKGHEVAIGGTLYSDALGNAGTEEGTYIGMYKYNVQTIVNALR
ncbi:metal ABC transporter solute-binding protein, Zn/Mn family [Kordia jejudonensis]|uniref:metal ABC transporter solute-binding protein, Zn/Mn family n=1 Tax=Kordia jejudonensis TaxID=1348245 RepID=UPI0006297AF0|nr:zinc ABC transporter substrate-binding protein [Kordia jejudonensis]